VPQAVGLKMVLLPRNYMFKIISQFGKLNDTAKTCTFIALTSGIFAGFMGGQIAVNLSNQKCQTQGWGFKELCYVSSTPIAIWQGTITGAWTGAVLGAFIGGLMTKQSPAEKSGASSKSAIK
jgi:hypothetical protein